jgi:hypothetical protein
MLLRATADVLRVVTGNGGASILAHVSAVETDASTPPVVQDLVRVNTAAITTATTTTILDCTTTNRRRRLLTCALRNDHATATEYVKVQHYDGTTAETIIAATLLPGESLIMTASGQWVHYDANGAIYGATPGQQNPSVLVPPTYANAALTGTKTLTSGTAFAVYLGKATKPVTAVSLRYRVTTAAATITWAELAIAKGAINIGGNPTLTVVGYADVSAVINSTGQKSTTVNVSSGQTINAGDDLWAIIGNNATTAGVVRAATIADDIQVGTQGSVASRPSTIVGTPTAFTIESATTLQAQIAGVL